MALDRVWFDIGKCYIGGEWREAEDPDLIALENPSTGGIIGAIANGTEFGLVAGVWTQNGARQMRLARQLRAGQVFINNYGAGGAVELPFGGFGKSGHGRENKHADRDGMRQRERISNISPSLFWRHHADCVDCWWCRHRREVIACRPLPL